MTASNALADEAVIAIGEAMQRAAARGPAKIIALRTRLTDEGVRKIKDGDRKRHSLNTIVDFMKADAEVAAVIAHYALRFNEPDMFNNFDTQRDFHRDLMNAHRRMT